MCNAVDSGALKIETRLNIRQKLPLLDHQEKQSEPFLANDVQFVDQLEIGTVLDDYYSSYNGK